MPASEGTLTDADVAAELGVPVDARVTDCTDAARAWAEHRRDRTVRVGSPNILWSDPSVHRGGVLYAAAEYQSRVSPEGTAGYDPTIGGPMDTWTLRQRAAELVGLDVGIG